MSTFYRIAGWFCFLLGVGLLGVAGYLYWDEQRNVEPPPGQAITVHDPERDLGEQPVETPIDVRVRFTNASSQPLRILGQAKY